MNKSFFILFVIIFNIRVYAQMYDFKDFDFNKADQIAYSQKGKSLKNFSSLAYNLTDTLTTDVEKFRSIYTWVCTNIEGDYIASVINKEKRKKLQKNNLKLNNWNISFRTKVFEKLLNEHKTVCTGYAFLIKLLSNLANIECVIIDGYGRTANNEIGKNPIPNHSWNAVKLNSKWYLCDATWSSGSYNYEKSQFTYDYNDGYFLTNPELFIKDHYPLDSNWVLTNQPYDLSNFMNQPFVYGNTYKYGILPIKPCEMNIEVEQYKETQFLLNTSKPIYTSQIKIELVSGTNSQAVEPTKIHLKDNSLEIIYKFENKGLYDVHFKIDNNVVLTYVVKVKKAK